MARGTPSQERGKRPLQSECDAIARERWRGKGYASVSEAEERRGREGRQGEGDALVREGGRGRAWRGRRYREGEGGTAWQGRREGDGEGERDSELKSGTVEFVPGSPNKESKLLIFPFATMCTSHSPLCAHNGR